MKQAPFIPWHLSFHQSNNDLENDKRMLHQEIIAQDPFIVRVSTFWEAYGSIKSFVDDLEYHLANRMKETCPVPDPGDLFLQKCVIDFSDNGKHNDRQNEVLAASNIFKRIIIANISGPTFDYESYVQEFLNKLENTALININIEES